MNNIKFAKSRFQLHDFHSELTPSAFFSHNHVSPCFNVQFRLRQGISQNILELKSQKLTINHDKIFNQTKFKENRFFLKIITFLTFNGYI